VIPFERSSKVSFGTIRSALAIVAASCSSCVAAAQEPAADDASTAAAETWEFSGLVSFADPPDDDAYVTPILYADRGPLHLEARYGYEDLDTLSLFAGWTFSVGEEIAADITPMLGAVTGDTDGIAPGLEAEVAWNRLTWYTEAEYLFDSDGSDEDFFYSWSTLTWSFTDWLSAGLVAERTKLVDTDFDVQRGLALEFTHGSFGFSVYAYNVGSDDSYAVLALAFAP
jgi:hypothetical protein